MISLKCRFNANFNIISTNLKFFYNILIYIVHGNERLDNIKFNFIPGTAVILILSKRLIYG